MTPQEAITELLTDKLCLMAVASHPSLVNVEEIGIAISALEKQIPKKTTEREYVPNGTLIYGHCPNCDCFTKNFFKYCGNCGQALDWSDAK